MPGFGILVVSAWPAEGITPLAALTLDSIAETWDGIYDVGLANGLCMAYRLTGGDLLVADTPDGIESAIRADYARWIAA